MTITEPVLTGPLDVACVQPLRELALKAAGAEGDVTFDCEGVERIDAAAAQVLLALARTLERRGHRLWLRGLPERPATLLRKTGFAVLVGESTQTDDRKQQEVDRG